MRIKAFRRGGDGERHFCYVIWFIRPRIVAPVSVDFLVSGPRGGPATLKWTFQQTRYRDQFIKIVARVIRIGSDVAVDAIAEPIHHRAHGASPGVDDMKNLGQRLLRLKIDESVGDAIAEVLHLVKAALLRVREDGAEKQRN